MDPIFKTFAGIKDVDTDARVVRAYWSAFGNEDADGDIIEQGAFAGTIARRGPQGTNRIKTLWQHDPFEPIGRPTKLEEDDHGLLAEMQISETRRGKDALTLYEDGVITEHSIGLEVLTRSDEDRRHIKETELWEGSPVTWGANPLTPTLEVRSDGNRIEPLLRRLSEQVSRARKALKSGISEELAEDIELWLATTERRLEIAKTARKTKEEADEKAGDLINSNALAAIRQANKRLRDFSGKQEQSEDPLSFITTANNTLREL